MSIDVKFTSHMREMLEELKDRIPVALEACGLAAEGYAKRLCAVDTGLLRNSITHALDGEATAIASYTDNDGVQHGEYRGSTPWESGNTRRAVYIGTNVEYAPYVEMGTSRTVAQPFIQPAVEGHAAQYKKIMESYLK